MKFFASGIISCFLMLLELRLCEGVGFDFIQDQTDEQDELMYALNTHFNDFKTFHAKGYNLVPQESKSAVSEDTSLSIQSTGALVAKSCFVQETLAMKLGVCSAIFNTKDVGLGSFILKAYVPSGAATNHGPGPAGYSIFNTSASVYRTLDCTGTLLRERVHYFYPTCQLLQLSNTTQYRWDWSVVPVMPAIPLQLDYGILMT